MPIPGYGNVSSSDNFVAGGAYTRLRGVAIAGQIADGGVSGGPLPGPSGVVVIQSTASVTNQIVTTSATGLARASFFYIPVTTGNIIGAGAPAFVGTGTALMWNDTAKALAIWSSGSSSWMQQLSSVGGGYWTTS